MAPPGNQDRVAVSNCCTYGAAMRNMIVSGSIFATYGVYMAPYAYFFGKTFAVEMERRARDTAFCRSFPAVLEEYPGISIRGGPFYPHPSIC